MNALLLAPMLLQGAVIAVDEFYCHWRRGLDRWERIGHPLDTLTFIACFAWALALPYGRENLLIYAGIAAFSSVFITKDEWVHAASCDAFEQWLHALLFVLHPLVLVSVAVLWAAQAGALPMGQDVGWLWRAVGVQCGLMVLFGGYQIAYWGWFARSR